MTGSVRNALVEMKRSVSKPGDESFYNSVERSQRIGAVYAEARDKIIPVMNAAAVNTVDTGLKRGPDLVQEILSVISRNPRNSCPLVLARCSTMCPCKALMRS